MDGVKELMQEAGRVAGKLDDAGIPEQEALEWVFGLLEKAWDLGEQNELSYFVPNPFKKR